LVSGVRQFLGLSLRQSPEVDKPWLGVWIRGIPRSIGVNTPQIGAEYKQILDDGTPIVDRSSQ